MIALYYSFHGRVDTRIFRVEKHRLQRNVNFLRNLRIISRTLAADRDRDRRPVCTTSSLEKGNIAWRKSRKSVVPSPPLPLALNIGSLTIHEGGRWTASRENFPKIPESSGKKVDRARCTVLLTVP